MDKISWVKKLSAPWLWNFHCLKHSKVDKMQNRIYKPYLISTPKSFYFQGISRVHIAADGIFLDKSLGILLSDGFTIVSYTIFLFSQHYSKLSGSLQQDTVKLIKNIDPICILRMLLMLRISFLCWLGETKVLTVN